MNNFYNKILRMMDVETNEASLVLLLLTQSVFLGIFFGAFDTAANAIFLGEFASDQLPLGFTISGVAGIIMTTLYSNLQSKISFSKLALLNLFTVAIITTALWFGFSYTSSNWLAFMVLVMMGPLNILAMLGFWGTAGRLFTLRQGKRLFGLVDSGQIIGVIVSSYAIPVFLTLNFKTKDLLLISAITATVALVFQFLLTFKTTNLSHKVEKVKAHKSESGLISMMKNPFVRLMSFFVSLSMVTAFFISFSFLAVTKMKYPDTNAFAMFLGVFVGTVMIFTLLIKTLAYSKFMKNYGLKTSLVISPILLLLLSVIAAVVGIIGGTAATAGGFLFFFICIALSRLFSVSLKSSIEAPSFKILYQTVDASIRHQVQARVDGTINEISALLSGIILMIMGSLTFIKLINFTQVLLILLAAWAYVAFKLYKAYKNNLDSSLTSLKNEQHTSARAGNTGMAARLLTGNEKADDVVLVLNMQEKTQPIVYETLIPYLVHHKLNEVKKYALEKGASLHLYEMLETLKDTNDGEFAEQSNTIIKQLRGELEKGLVLEQIVTLSRSKIVSDRELAARLAGEHKDPKITQTIKFLLRDFDSGVKIAAIRASSKLKHSELAPVLAEFLATDEFGRYASDALIEIGEDAIDYLENIFNKSGNDSTMQTRIVRIIGSINSDKANKSLINKINYHDTRVAVLASNMLLKLKYKVDPDHYYLLHQSLLKVLEITSWNIAARASLKDSKADILLFEAFNVELHNSYNQIFTLLSLMFDPQSIQHIRQSIESESAESTGYALELLDLIITDDIKPVLFPILDENSDTEKIKQLQHHFPVDKTPLNQLLINIINRDYNYIGAWTKACALQNILEIDNVTISDDIVAQLFNPDELLSSLAAQIIQKNRPELLPTLFKRLDEKQRVRIQYILKQAEENKEKLLFNKMKFLKQCKKFSSVNENALYNLARNIEPIVFRESDEIEIIDEDLAIRVFILADGIVTNASEGNYSIDEIGSMFGGILEPGYPKQFPIYAAANEVKLYRLHQDIFDKLILDNPDFAEEILIKHKNLTHNKL